MTKITLAPKSAPKISDGRHARSQSSRERIVTAMMELIRSGDMNPSAARVAEEAGVGLRTVFRQFDDMDAIYTEISAKLSQQLLPIAMAPFVADDWRDNICDLARRRVLVFETMLPFRLAANMRRYASPFLMAQYAQIVNLEHELTLRQIPDEVRRQRVTVQAICAALSFQNWAALRHDQQLTAEDAGSITLHMVQCLMASAP